MFPAPEVRRTKPESPEAEPETPETPAAPTPQAPPKSKPASELEEERKRNEELLGRLKRTQADFENYRKQVTRETETVVKFANEALLARLLPVLDDFDAALRHLEGEDSKGVRMVHDNLLRALAAAGLQEIPAEGQKFDPYVHDCVQQVPDPELEDGLVKGVVRRGYRMSDRVLRPAQVIVVSNGSETHG